MRFSIKRFLEKLSLLISLTIIIVAYQNCGEISAQKVGALDSGGAEIPSGSEPIDDGDSGDNGDPEPQPEPTPDPVETEFMKPTGVYSSVLSGSNTDNPIVKHESAKGVLLRTSWNKLEPVDDQFDFSSIDDKIAIIKQNQGSKEFYYTLAISAGCGGSTDPGYPKWMNERSDIEKWTIIFRNNTCTMMPRGWDDNYLAELKELALALAEHYKDDLNLKMIYVPQATGNGIEGHFNGNHYIDPVTGRADPNDWTPLISQGITKENWKYALKEASIAFAQAFPDRAVALELHNVIGRVDIPIEAINEIYEDPRSGKRVGAAMWWLFGKDLELELAQGMTDFPGDVYGQVGANSTQPLRVGLCDYRRVLDMAVDMGMRYIEPWDKEFKVFETEPVDPDRIFELDQAAYDIQKENFRKFNEYVISKFERGENPSKPIFDKPEPKYLDPSWDPAVETSKSCPGDYFLE